ncbi:hypothetical protein [Granulicoccus sp. GXG6511]|uniref:hypothetical protein n=1 Tax=Granulicoccus sp. GXG6511 TaxID=3381351 RepID=UPI003D7E262F
MSASGSAVDPQATAAEADFYEAIPLDRDATTEEIRQRLHTLKLQWGARAGKAGQTGEQARTKLALIERALDVFANEDARELYDLSLRRKPDAGQPEELVIDWLARAWTYYFIEDEGAAGVAARKAKEQAPDNPLTYVVSAWVNLMRDEIRDAKRDADEAFVLDELGEDTVDVHHVRGVVFFQQKIYDKAHQSFDRALAKAVPFEQVTLHLRKAWAFEQEHKASQMFDALERALSIPVDIDSAQRDRLHRTTYFAVEHLIAGEHGTVARRTLQRLSQRVKNSKINERSKTDILRFIDLAVQRADLEAQAAELASVAAPEGLPADIPFKSLGVALVAFFLAFELSFFWLVFLGAAGFAGFMIYHRVQWSQTKKAFESAQAELASIHEQIMRKTTVIERTKSQDALTAR